MFSLTKEQIAEECQALQDEAEMDIEQLRKLYGHIEDENTESKKPEPNVNIMYPYLLFKYIFLWFFLLPIEFSKFMYFIG